MREVWGDMLAGRSSWPSFFAQTVARLQWNPAAIDMTEDVRARPGLAAERRRPLTTLLAGFRVAEDAVAEELTPFAEVARKSSMASNESLVAWVFFLQRRDEQRHAALRPHRRGGAGAPRSDPCRAPRGGPRARPGGAARAL